MRLLCGLTGLLAVCCGAHAQSTIVVPSAAYPGDSVFIPLQGGGSCNAAEPDRSRLPRVNLTRRFDTDFPDSDVYVYSVEYWLVEADGVLCGTPPPPGVFYADVGPLPNGLHRFEIIGHIEGVRFSEYSTNEAWVRRHPGLPGDVAGLWYEPSQSGRGLTVTRTGFETLSLLWFTHDANGLPHWVASSARGVDGQGKARGDAFDTRGTPLAPGPANLTARPWGELEFTYVGCGRAELRWVPLDPAIPAATQPLSKLAQEYSAARCAPEISVGVIWGVRP